MRPGGDAGAVQSLRVADLGELGLLARIAARVGAPGEGVVLGIGDDTAALRIAGGSLVLLTTDAVVEGVHFRRETSSAADVGWKALAINASDIAAMGGRPRHAAISLMLPGHTEVAWVDGLYDGLLEMARAAGITLVGGNLAQAPAIIIDVALLGEVAPGRLIRRDGARPGDLLAVTGSLGRAAAGLVALSDRGREGRPSGPGDPVARAVLAQRRPQPRLVEGRTLAATGAVHAMIDLSDGLALDLWRICEASGVGVRLDASRLPVDPCVAAVADDDQGLLALAVGGGEDYELLVALDAEAAAQALDTLARETEVPATIIGEFRPASAGRTLVVDGTVRPLQPGGWTHFRTGETL